MIRGELKTRSRQPFVWFAMLTAMLVSVLIASVIALGVSRADEPAKQATAEDVPLVDWGLSPYRVQLVVQVDSAPGWSAARRKAFIADVATRAGGLTGGLWQVAAAEAPSELRWRRAADIERAAIDAMPPALAASDKVILLGLKPEAVGSAIWAREWDERTHGAGPVLVEQGSAQSAPRELVEQMVRAAWSAFRPLARIDSLSDQGPTLRIRGGAIPAASRALELAHVGTCWRVVIRHFDAAGQTVKDGVFSVADTWLRTAAVDGAAARCTLVTGVQDPLAIEYDGRTEYLALAATGRPSNSTAIVCRSRASTELPLAGLDVVWRTGAGGPPHNAGQTDADGVLTVSSATPEALIVYISSGNDILARFPLVPGLLPQITVSLDDTGRRPELAEYVDSEKVELLDLSTQQRLLATRLQREAMSGHSDEAAKTIATLKTLSTSDEFIKALDEFRTKWKAGLGASDPASNAWLEKRLDELKTAAASSLIGAADMSGLERKFAH